ncbi:MAG: SPOR domain-containing protein [Mucilaginibacter sp.]
MDVGFYISELLEQRGDVSVPGLGYLIQARVGGYYSEAEQKIYPPHNEVQFEPRLADDDTTLTQYIADKKNISLASSQYFTEKYITNLKQEALTAEVPMASIGSFYYKGNQLVFRPAQKIANDAAFYGFQPVKATRLGLVSIPKPAPEPQSVYVQPVLIPENAEEDIVEEDESFYEEPESRNLLRIWLLLIGVIFIAAVAAFALYKYKPDTFEKVVSWRPNFMRSKPPIKGDLKIADKRVDSSTYGQQIDSSARTGAATMVKTDTGANKVAIPATTPTKTNVTTNPTPATPAVSGAINKPAMATAAPPVKEAVKTKSVILTVPGPQNPVTDKTTAPKTRRFEIILQQTGTMADANNVVNAYKAKGVTAHVIKNGGSIKVSVGPYRSINDAEVEMGKLIEAGKITDESYPMEIK